MTGSSETIRVVIPLTIRKAQRAAEDPAARRCDRSGRPVTRPPCAVRVARAWNWRRQLETGTASSIQDIAAEKASDRFISRMMRLAYLSPEVLERLVIRRGPPALSLKELVAVAELPWGEQMDMAFEGNVEVH